MTEQQLARYARDPYAAIRKIDVPRDAVDDEFRPFLRHMAETTAIQLESAALGWACAHTKAHSTEKLVDNATTIMQQYANCQTVEAFRIELADAPKGQRTVGVGVRGLTHDHMFYMCAVKSRTVPAVLAMNAVSLTRPRSEYNSEGVLCLYFWTPQQEPPPG